MPNYSDKYIQKWISYLNGVDRDLCQMAPQKLGQTKNPAVVPELVKSLRNRPDDIRIAAARALGTIGDPQAVDSLVELLEDDNPLIAAAAADALGEIAHASAVPALTHILREHQTQGDRFTKLRGFNRGVYMAAVHALKRIDTPQARQALQRYYR